MFKIFRNFSAGVTKTRQRLFGSIATAFRAGKIDATAIDEIERALYSADFGVKATQSIVSEIKAVCGEDPSIRGEDVLKIAAAVVKKSLVNAEAELPVANGKPLVICLMGVNGSGKTTTAAKLAHFYKTNGYSVMLAGCDTFRAAALEQIRVWADRLAVDLVSGNPGGDAAAVAYDAYQSAFAKKCDVLILDTAGRLHVKSNLMAELQKIAKILKKFEIPPRISNWLVIDGSIGANSIESAKIFHGDIGLHGLIMTKLDGSSRGGAIVGIHNELEVPILFLGTGEKPEDIVRFSVDKYIAELFGGKV